MIINVQTYAYNNNAQILAKHFSATIITKANECEMDREVNYHSHTHTHCIHTNTRRRQSEVVKSEIGNVYSHDTF